MQLDKYMESFQKELELTDSLKTHVMGSYLIPLDGGINILISSTPSGFSCFSEITKFSAKNEEVIYYQLLKANLFGQGTKDAVLGLNDQGNMLTISRVVDYNIEYEGFKEIIEDFIKTVDFWNEQIQANKT